MLSGLLLAGAFPHLDWGWLAWVALIPFLLSFPHGRLRAALAHGAVLGLVFFGGLLYWIAVFAAHPVGPVLGGFAWLAAALSQSATLVAFAVGAYGLRSTGNIWAWRLGVPALWTLGEWGRQFGILGTGWGDLAYTQHADLPLLQLTKLTGVWGLSFLIVLVNVAAAEWLGGLGTPSPYRVRRFPLAVALVVLAALVYGMWALRTEDMRPTVTAAALQGNINQDVKLDAAYITQVMQTFSAQGKKAAARGARLTVWPETALPGYLRDDPALRDSVVRDAVRYQQAILVGGRDRDTRLGKDRNTLTLVTPKGQVAGAYAKQHLVPFGEYVPLRAQFPILERLHLSIYDMAAGDETQPLLEAGAPVGTVGAAICYDSTDGRLMRDQVARGAGLLVVSTDDTWFGRTAAARQHAAMAAVRAAETDRYLVRCAATGVSQVIAPNGRVLAEAGLFRKAVVSSPVQPRATRTLYVRAGDWFVAGCAGLLAGLAGLSARGRLQRSARSLGR